MWTIQERNIVLDVDRGAHIYEKPPLSNALRMWVLNGCNIQFVFLYNYLTHFGESSLFKQNHSLKKYN